MKQQSLFHDDIHDALRAVVDAIGGAKRVGHSLRPDLDPRDAGRWLLKALDPERAEVLKPSQMLLLLKWGREADCHVAMFHISDECGYGRPEPVNPESERDRLRREYVEAVKRMEKLTAQMQRFAE